MINPKELRLENLLLSGKNVVLVTSISADQVEVVKWPRATDLQESLAGNLQYLPLSEDWMNKFSGDGTGYLSISGLERTSDSSDIVILSTIECYLHDDGFLRVCAYEYEKHPDDSIDISDDVITLGYKHIKYVHQLQNLYFDLTGKELEVK